MANLLAVTASPSPTSRTAAVTDHVADRLRGHGHQVQVLPLRTLPAAALLAADRRDPEIAAANAALAQADGVIVATPIYKAAYSGLLKVWLDQLNQDALTGKAVLPLATGGSLAHVLAIDYGLRPVLASMGARHIVPGWFLLDQWVRVGEAQLLSEGADEGLHRCLDAFRDSLSPVATPLVDLVVA
ncbi:MAG: NADPH-dependent FMN reductase [Kineosporiaceae bacterium]